MVSVCRMETNMGTYTTNYQLYTPTVGETGWGTLVNGNFTTIDSTMKSLSNRITAVESEVNGALSCTSVTASGKITGNGGIAGTTGTFSGVVSASKGFKGTNYTVTQGNALIELKVSRIYGSNGDINILSSVENTFSGTFIAQTTTNCFFKIVAFNCFTSTVYDSGYVGNGTANAPKVNTLNFTNATNLYIAMYGDYNYAGENTIQFKNIILTA